MEISVVVPCRDETGNLLPAARRLAARRDIGEIIMVDASRSADVCRYYVRERSAFLDLAEQGVKFVGAVDAGRAMQMNLGAGIAGGDLLLFLHVDSILPEEDLGTLLEGENPGWGRFDVELDDPDPWARMVAWMMNLRSRLSGIATGDQGIFVDRRLWDSTGGFASIPLMEDIELSARLRRSSWPRCLRPRVVTSARRWRERGVMRTILLMWTLRLGYWLGVEPRRLAAYYRDVR